MTPSRQVARFVLLALLGIVSVATGCTPASVPSTSASATKARTPLVVIPASSKTYSDRGVVAWKVYPYLSGKIGGFTIVGVDTKSNVKRVTRVFDVPSKVKNGPPSLVYSPLYPKTSARTVLGNTGLVWQASMSSNTKARHLADVAADATSYLPKAPTQGDACSTSVKRIMSCLAAPALGDLSARWTQVRACRLAMAHLVKPASCIKHSVKLAIPTSSAKTKDGDDDDMVAGDDDDDSTQQDNTDQQDNTQQDNTDQQDQQNADQQNTDQQNADQQQNPGDFTAGTDQDPQPDANTQQADTTPTDQNGLGAAEATQAQGNAPIPSAGETQQDTTQQDTTQNPTPDTGCGASTESLHVLTAGVCTAPTANATPEPTADQGAFGATASQATCSSNCGPTTAAPTADTTTAPVPVPTTVGGTVQASVSAGTLNVNASVTWVPSDPNAIYVGVGAGATTQVANVSVGAGPIVVRGDPTQVLTGTSVTSDTGAGGEVVGGQVEVQTNKSGTTVSMTGQLGASAVPVPITVGAGVSYGWRVPIPSCSEQDLQQGSCVWAPPM